MACYLYNGIKYTEEDLVKLLQSQQPKTRRILELQSDLFQKGRGKEDLVNRDDEGEIKFSTKFTDYTINGNNINAVHENGFVENFSMRDLYNRDKSEQDLIRLKIKEYKDNSSFNKKENQFLQLLNKDNNWVTFFTKSIIQQTAKERIYEASLPDIEEKVLSLQKEGKLKIDCK